MTSVVLNWGKDGCALVVQAKDYCDVIILFGKVTVVVFRLFQISIEFSEIDSPLA